MVGSEARVRYADTDAMGVAYHANFLVWFEVGRVELMRAWAVPHIRFQEAGMFTPVIESHVRWVHPARYDDLLSIQTSVIQLTPTRVKFSYRILRQGDERLLCEGWTLHTFVTGSGRPVALTRQARDLYDLFRARVDSESAQRTDRGELGE